MAFAVVLLGSCNDPGQLAAPLRAPGYLDHNIALPAPGAQERASMLASHLSARGAQFDVSHLQVTFALHLQPFTSVLKLSDMTCTNGPSIRQALLLTNIAKGPSSCCCFLVAM